MESFTFCVEKVLLGCRQILSEMDWESIMASHSQVFSHSSEEGSTPQHISGILLCLDSLIQHELLGRIIFLHGQEGSDRDLPVSQIISILPCVYSFHCQGNIRICLHHYVGNINTVNLDPESGNRAGLDPGNRVGLDPGNRAGPDPSNRAGLDPASRVGHNI